MRKLGILFSYLVAKIWSLLPWSLNLLMARLLAFIWLDIFRLRKDVIYGNLKIAFPNMSTETRTEVSKQSTVALCRTFFDVFKIPYLSEKWIDENVIFDGQHVIEKIRQSDEGFFFLSLHLGSGDLAAAIISERIRPITLISKRFRSDFLDAFWFGLRERSKTLFINAHSKNNAFEILSALKKKRAVVFVLDQFMGMPYGVETQFFGVPTGTAYGLALFAKKTKKPVYPLYTYWDENSKLHICVDEAIDLSQELSENYDVITEKFNRVLERIITAHPMHWMWVHRRWKKFE